MEVVVSPRSSLVPIMSRDKVSKVCKLQQLTIPPNVLLWIINFLSGKALLRPAKLLVGYRSPKASYKDLVLAPIFTWCMSQTCRLCRLTLTMLHHPITMLSSSTPTILHYSSANTVQLTCNRNMITSVPGLPETGLPLILIKLKKLFFFLSACLKTS